MTDSPSIPSIPLPERMRPDSLEGFVGQQHLVGPGAVLRKMIESGNISSFILWGPPGVGKTTLAHIVSKELRRDFYTLSAISSGVKDLRDVFTRAKDNSIFAKGSPILFIDEIHRFSKSQQDALLGAVETGTVTLIGATTENPSFEVITPLLSRCQVFVMKPLDTADLDILLGRALTRDTYLRNRQIEVREKALAQYDTLQRIHKALQWWNYGRRINPTARVSVAPESRSDGLKVYRAIYESAFMD